MSVQPPSFLQHFKIIFFLLNRALRRVCRLYFNFLDLAKPDKYVMKFILNFQIFLNLHARFFLLPELVSTSEKIYIYIR